jgi:hypothetical protein
MVFAEKAKAAEMCMPGDDTYPPGPDPACVPRQGYRRVAVSLSLTP